MIQVHLRLSSYSTSDWYRAIERLISSRSVTGIENKFACYSSTRRFVNTCTREKYWGWGSTRIQVKQGKNLRKAIHFRNRKGNTALAERDLAYVPVTRITVCHPCQSEPSLYLLYLKITLAQDPMA